jgi:hypothetical protein
VPNKNWTEEEDSLLVKIVSAMPVLRDWSVISRYFPNKSESQLRYRWDQALDPRLVKGSWTRDEDEMIIRYVDKYGMKAWAKVANVLPGRIGKQCRERWMSHLNPAIDHGPWSAEEDVVLFELHEQLGNRWNEMRRKLPNRSVNSIKNRWYSVLSKRTEPRRQKTPLPSIKLLPKPNCCSLTSEDRRMSNAGESIWQEMPFLMEMEMEMEDFTE